MDFIEKISQDLFCLKTPAEHISWLLGSLEAIMTGFGRCLI